MTGISLSVARRNMPTGLSMVIWERGKLNLKLKKMSSANTSREMHIGAGLRTFSPCRKPRQAH